MIEKKSIPPGSVHDILGKSLEERDPFCKQSLSLLTALGLAREESLCLLASYKSQKKYGYSISEDTLSHIVSLARQTGPLQRLSESPFFLIKACWLYEHAPFFLLYARGGKEGLDAYILRFAQEYEDLFVRHKVPTGQWEGIDNPRRIMAGTFWEKQFDPVSLIAKAKDQGIEGIELSIDFHPFNYCRLLPEELSKEKREEIKEACKRSGIKLDIHSPIVGPYSPSPDPQKGKQLFFDPLQCFNLQTETIELAKDIGAGAVVFHLIDSSNLKGMAELIMKAAGSDVRVTIENYYMLKEAQHSGLFISYMDEIYQCLPKEVREKNFGITMDVGHLNVEGEDPLCAAEKIGRWCIEKRVFLRLHTTDNYGKLLFGPPYYSADVHGNVSGQGINNSAIIRLLRSMGLHFDVLAEQIKPLSPKDIEVIHSAQTATIDMPYETYVQKGQERISSTAYREMLGTDYQCTPAPYLFLAGIDGISALREHLIYRNIQEKKYLSVDDAQRVTRLFMEMPKRFKGNLIGYLDDLLLPIQAETGIIDKSKIDLICQNISGAVFATLNEEHLDMIFSKKRAYGKGEVICAQNSTAHEMYLIKEGEADVSVNGSLLATLGTGEICGEISLFFNVKRSATIKAKSDKTIIGILTRKEFENLLSGSPSYMHSLIYRLYIILPQRLRNLNEKYKTAINSLNLILDKDGRGVPGIGTGLGAKLDPFSCFPENEKGEILKNIREYDQWEILFSEGDKGDGAYYIIDGRVRASTFSNTGEEIALGELGAGEIFGEMALIDDSPRSASIRTLTPCRLAFIDKKGFHQIIEERSELSFRLMSFICLSIFRRILRLDRMYSAIKKRFVTK